VWDNILPNIISTHILLLEATVYPASTSNKTPSTPKGRFTRPTPLPILAKVIFCKIIVFVRPYEDKEGQPSTHKTHITI
jgi:hypothetical protein